MCSQEEDPFKKNICCYLFTSNVLPLLLLLLLTFVFWETLGGQQTTSERVMEITQVGQLPYVTLLFGSTQRDGKLDFFVAARTCFR